MVHVTLRFYADLNAFLPRARRQVAFLQRLTEPASVKDVIEARGVPHTAAGEERGCPASKSSIVMRRCGPSPVLVSEKGVRPPDRRLSR